MQHSGKESLGQQPLVPQLTGVRTDPRRTVSRASASNTRLLPPRLSKPSRVLPPAVLSSCCLWLDAVLTLHLYRNTHALRGLLTPLSFQKSHNGVLCAPLLLHLCPLRFICTMVTSCLHVRFPLHYQSPGGQGSGSDPPGVSPQRDASRVGGKSKWSSGQILF